jgi:type I restriction-modification system DNA methylase subunit
LENLLNQTYSQENFLAFCREFLTENLNLSRHEEIEQSNPKIQSAEYFGRDESLNLIVLGVEHSSAKDPRVTLTRSIQKLMKNYGLENALVALYSADSDNWRLSLITNTVGDGLKQEFTNPKRYSYLLGPGAKTVTAKRQLKDSVQTLEALKESFSLEVVTKEFYENLESLYKKLYQRLSLPPQSNVTDSDKKDFALRLIGRLIFCWFLKEKNWISDKILSSETAKSVSDKDDYYRTALEPLFFETLNKEKEDRNYSIGTNEFLQNNHKKIPYLNGGLFEPQTGDYYQQFPKSVPNEFLSEIMNLFETYHFTIDENTSTEQEIGVDPEMMGRIFENFILNRSATGSFYTPREIVDYMVETSLLELLKKDLSLNKLEDGDFQEYVSRDDYDFLKLKDKLNQVYVIENFWEGLNVKVPLRVVAKIRGWQYVHKDDVIKQTKHRHKEVGPEVWRALDSGGFELEEVLLGNFKKVRIGKKNYSLPTLSLILKIQDRRFAVFVMLKGSKNLELSTIFAVDEKKLSKLRIASEQNSRFSEFADFLKNYSKQKTSAGGGEKYSLADATSPHTFPDFSGWQHHDKFSALREYLYKILPNRPNFVKFGLESNPIFEYIDLLLYSNKHRFDADKIIAYLDSLKTLDPACGSGAFPIGVLQKMVDLYHYLGQTETYQVKKRVLENSIYGVDILPIAVEISRLRCWLSLVVDEDNGQPEPLPNLEFKFVCGNSLVGIGKSPEGLVDPEVESKQQELEILRKKTFKSGENKGDLNQKWIDLTYDLSVLQASQFGDKEYTDKITSWNPFTNQPADFFDPEWMFGLSDFDLVIGNPPYVQLQSLNPEEKTLYKNQNYQTHTATGDLYQLFYERGWQLLKPLGILSFITSNKWMRAGYGKTTRSFLVNQANPLVLLDLGPNVFESATVDTNVLVFSKQSNQGKTKAVKVTKAELKSLTQEAESINFSSEEGWFIGTPAQISLKKKIEQAGKPLKDWDVNIYRGVLTGLNEAFIINEDKKKELIAQDPKSAEIIKPILRGRDIKRYGYEFANLYLIATFPSLQLDIDNYPAIKEHLLGFDYKKLEQAGNILPDGTKGRKRTGNKWFETQDQIAYHNEFEKEKIVWPMVSTSNCSFCVIPPNQYLNNKCYLITGGNLKFILGILNSSTGWNYFKSTEAGLGDSFEIRKEGVENFPIPALDTPEKKELAERVEVLVNKILALKKESLGADTAHLESQIDELVFDLYGLTGEERGLILNGS